MSNTPIGSPRVTVIHSIARYSAGFGGTSAFNGRILGLMGEMVEEQLPPMVQFPEEAEANLLHGLLLENINVQPTALVDAYFTGAAPLEVMRMVPLAQGGVRTNLSRLCPIPLAWAPYFMDFKTPYEACKMGEALVGTLANAAERAHVDPLLDWLRAGTQRLSGLAAERTRSILEQELEATVPPPRVTTWMATRLRQFRRAPNPVFPQGVAEGVAGTGAEGVAGRVAGLPHDTAGKTYSPLEVEKLQAVCGLTDDQWDTNLPPLFSRMLEEGRKTAKVRALILDLVRPSDAMSLDVVVIHVTDEMAQDIKELNFGYNREMEYDTAHRGLSPFTVVGISMATASRRRRKAERTKRATHITLTDVKEGDTTPDPLPQEYNGLILLLRRYLGLLVKVVGILCPHYLKVLAITRTLVRETQSFEQAGPQAIASLVWQIFLDSRRFFSDSVDGDGNLPASNLSYILNQLSAGLMTIHTNVPYQELTNAPGTGQEDTVPRGPTERNAGRKTETSTGPHVYGGVPAEIKLLLAGAVTKHPTITMAKVMAAETPPVPYQAMKLGKNGACLDFLALGQCATKNCSFNHDKNIHIDPAQLRKVLPKLRDAYAKYEANS
jgi:hypothetical protein